MEDLIKKMDELEDLLKAISPSPATAPKPPSIKPTALPGRPTGVGMPRSALPKAPSSGIKPTSKKNPLAVARHLEDPNLRDLKVQEAKEAVGFNARGQWSLK